MTISILLFAAVCFLAYSNGSNDNFKGVASIYGSKTASYKTSLGWATITTLLGSVVSFFIANGLLQKFSGKGIVPNDLAGSEYFLLAVAVGAGATVILATLTGFPISTTHGLTGAIVGAGLMAVGGLLNARKVAETMSNDITAMNSGQAFSANLGTGFLVIFASSFGVPVSTTHVSVGSLFGIGLVTKQADLRVVSGIVLWWIITLPCAAIIAGLTFWLINLV